MSVDNGATALPAPEAPSQRNRKVKNLLINRRFQLKWVSLILLLTLALFGSLGGYIWEHERHSSDAIINGLSTLYDAEEVAVMKDLFVASDSDVLYALMGSGAMLIVLLAGVGLVLTHKMAGPVYALRHSMDRVSEGKLYGVRGVRDGDEFQELASSWLSVVETLKSKEETEVEQIDEIARTEGLPDEAKAALQRLAAQKRAYLS